MPLQWGHMWLLLIGTVVGSGPNFKTLGPSSRMWVHVNVTWLSHLLFLLKMFISLVLLLFHCCLNVLLHLIMDVCCYSDTLIFFRVGMFESWCYFGIIVLDHYPWEFCLTRNILELLCLWQIFFETDNLQFRLWIFELSICRQIVYIMYLLL